MSSQQTKPNYCMCCLPLPSLLLSAFMDEKEYLKFKKKKKTNKNKKNRKFVLLQEANAVK